MPSQRRMRVFALLVTIVIIGTLYMSSSARQTRQSEFYLRTQEALQNKEYEQATKERTADNVASRLKAAEDAAKKKAAEKGDKWVDSIEGSTGEKSVAGRVKLDKEGGDKKKLQGVATVGGKPRDRHGDKKTEHETQEEHEVEVELNAILKKSPIIIFSKTFCPFSKKAKHILLDNYRIVPAPYVVELDEHPLGPQLQATLAESTGRKTVPNVLLMGKSIGGGDDIEHLHLTNKLLDTIKSMGGSRIIEATYRDSSSDLRAQRRRRA